MGYAKLLKKTPLFPQVSDWQIRRSVIEKAKVFFSVLGFQADELIEFCRRTRIPAAF